MKKFFAWLKEKCNWLDQELDKGNLIVNIVVWTVFGVVFCVVFVGVGVGVVFGVVGGVIGVVISAWNQEYYHENDKNGIIGGVIKNLIERKSATYWRTALVLFATMLFMLMWKLIFNPVGVSFDAFWPAVLVLILILLCAVKRWVMRYRVNHGFFGTNADEARELIYFMLENQRKGGKSGGMKLDFQPEGLAETVIRESAGGEVHAG